MEILSSKFFFFSTLCLLCAFTNAAEIRYCDENADYEVSVKGVEISPDPPVRGQPVTMSIDANTVDKLSNAKLVIGVVISGAYIPIETHDLCEVTSCPVSGGDFVITYSPVLFQIYPPARYTVQMKLLDGNNQLTCFEFDFTLALTWVV
ncbi:putative phosphatidylglycerol/phosphatidylinositol transfer protein DDB_G0282179 isoform X2 [Vigna radiata var. radiata]|uniref:Phosphatidylglycerol/phosphatidylinositol transfer protein DDB_G0282179 isoform X2 n=1 Tax=Vigna radiata var. radiata TaxID=3916 RepID=A0A1S3V4F4_VIGRR|nr:putative phosphatidylglycerol/phosphatidylinositol transfer protein DDB_G0282179 isoform X2 [Vigna radiata var. radiata]